MSNKYPDCFVKFEEVYVGMEVKDSEGIEGIVTKVEDIHKVYVLYPYGWVGMHCLDEYCEEFEPIYKKDRV